MDDWEEKHKQWYEEFKREQVKLERHMRRTRRFGLFVLAYLIFLVVTFVVSLFVPSIRDTANTIFLLCNFISLALVIWSLFRLRRNRLSANDWQSVFLYVVGAIAIIINLFTIYNHFAPFY